MTLGTRTATSALANGEDRPVFVRPAPAASERGDPACPHRAVEDLGLGGFARFLRCLSCGAVVIVQEGRRWQVDPVGRPRTAGNL